MDAESRKRTLQSLLKTGRSGGDASALDNARAATAEPAVRAVRHAASPIREGGGFFRDTLHASAERDTLGDQPRALDYLFLLLLGTSVVCEFAHARLMYGAPHVQVQ